MKKIPIIFLILIPAAVFAQDLSYNLSAPLPGLAGNKLKVTNLADYISYLFPFLLSIAAILAFVMFVIGGIEYMIRSGAENTQEAKNRIRDALLGLLLAVGSVLILQTINPNLVTLKLDVPKIKASPYVPAVPIGTPPPDSSTEPGGPTPPPIPDCSGTTFGGCPDGSACVVCDGLECPDSQTQYICKTINLGSCPDGAECRACSQKDIESCGWASSCIMMEYAGRWRAVCS